MAELKEKLFSEVHLCLLKSGWLKITADLKGAIV